MKRTAVKSPPASDFHIPEHVCWLVIFLSFVLAVISICTFKQMRRATYEMSGSIHALQLQLAHERNLLNTATTAKPEQPAAEEKPSPKVLTSVVKFRDGEQEALQHNLLVPLLSYYEAEPQPSPLSAVLVERKLAASKEVNVRLFFADGSETSYLWPSTHSNKDGLWIPSKQ